MKGKGLDEVQAELAQSGKSADEITRIKPHKVFEGNRPSNSIMVYLIKKNFKYEFGQFGLNK